MRLHDDSTWLANMDTAHFNFMALAPTRREALDTIRRGLRMHCRQCGIPAGSLLACAGEGDDNGDINVIKMTPLVPYRDWDTMKDLEEE